jgi:peptidyl-prolyl cis-trans isomerase A (cyclophilin A)
MAKIGGDPNSATNQWFVNLADNTNLDADNGGFTVFGQVLGDGMALLDAIDDLPTVNLGALAPSTPFITPAYDGNPLNFVYISATVMERFSGAPHVYETGTGKLLTVVSIDDGAALVSLKMDTVSSGGNTVLRVNPLSLVNRRDSFDGIATYSSADSRLRIPALEVNDGGQVSVFRNVVLVVSDPATGDFQLESFEQ